ncbi:hypothetical protein [Bradyrhizobium sp. DASA03120]|uniref:hypothetical protein n=1 Tax=Bradyrhizobium sp. SMVTL-02 TaxID=3395917 RepID=UPI003F701BA3
MIFFLTWTAFSVAVGLFASVRRNRSGFGWFLIAFIVSPVIAGVFCAILREKAEPVPTPTQYPALADLPASEQARLAKLRNDLAQ